jgi:hypothetical protein
MAKTNSTPEPDVSKPESSRKKKMSKAERAEIAWNATIGQTIDYFFLGATKQERERADVIRKELLAVGKRIEGKSAGTFNSRSLGMALADIVQQWAVVHAENLAKVPMRAPTPRKDPSPTNQ